MKLDLMYRDTHSIFSESVPTQIAEKRMHELTLDKIKKGKSVKIILLPEGNIKAQLIRLGISEGDIVKCSQRLPGGTIILKKSRQEIAIGFDLAKNIKVSDH